MLMDSVGDLKALNNRQTLALANKLYDDFLRKVATPLLEQNIQFNLRIFSFILKKLVSLSKEVVKAIHGADPSSKFL